MVNSTTPENNKKLRVSGNNRKLRADKNSLKNKIDEIENFVSGELKKYDENKLGSKNILYLTKDQLILNETDKELVNLKMNLNELKKIIREIVAEEIENKRLK